MSGSLIIGRTDNAPASGPVIEATIVGTPSPQAGTPIGQRLDSDRVDR